MKRNSCAGIFNRKGNDDVCVVQVFQQNKLNALLRKKIVVAKRPRRKSAAVNGLATKRTAVYFIGIPAVLKLFRSWNTSNVKKINLRRGPLKPGIFISFSIPRKKRGLYKFQVIFRRYGSNNI